MRTFLLLSALALLLAAANRSSATVTPYDLRCEYLTDPLGIDMAAPRLSWKLESSERNQVQSAYRLLAASKPEILKPGKADLWDTGRVASSETLHVRYAGRPLGSRTRCWWSVQAWDGKGKPSGWSKAAWFETALLKPADWQAKWINARGEVPDDKPASEPAAYFRRGFRALKPVRSARAYVCGLGMYEFSVNGRRVGDHRFGTNQTDYDRRSLKKLIYHFDDQTTKRVLYETFDITGQITRGENVAGVILGNGWYNQRERKVEGWMWYGAPRLICQIEITYRDGSRQTVATDGEWRWSNGPIGANSIFVGEEYDARRELQGWDRAGFKADWSISAEVRAPDGPLHAQMSPPDREGEALPCTYTETKPGVRLYDCGQSISGWARVHVSGPNGTTLRLRYFDELGEDYGQVDTYTLIGTGTEVWEPRFTWHGFRTVEVSGLTEGVNLRSVMAVPVHSSVEPAGTFSCSNQLLAKIQDNYVRTQLNNMHMGVPSDCPHRERLGYTGDGQISAPAAIYNLDMAAFYTKWIQDVRDVQNRNTGYVSHTAPFGGGGGGPAWGSAAVIMPWLMYQYYGDRDQLAKSYPSMKKWVDYLGTHTDRDGIVVREEPNGWCLGDWATPEKIALPEPLVNTAYYARVARMTGDAAAVFGRIDESNRLHKLADRIAEAFNQRFFQYKQPEPGQGRGTGHYSVGRQGADLFPLAFGLGGPAGWRQPVAMDAVLKNLAAHDNHLDTGILATPLLLDVLTDNDRVDLAYAVATQTTNPGWGYAISKGATTIWESWNGDGSHNHPMYGSISAWFYSRLAGIRPGKPGFKEFILRPELVDDLKWAGATYESVRGKIESAWRRTQYGLDYSFTIPPNTAALVYMPGSKSAVKMLDGSEPANNEGHLLRMEDGRPVYRFGSGKYSFTFIKGRYGWQFEPRENCRVARQAGAHPQRVAGPGRPARAGGGTARRGAAG